MSRKQESEPENLAVHVQAPPLAVERGGPQAMERLDVSAIAVRRQAILELMQSQMREGVHFGKSPGTSKPALHQPGAQMLMNLFQLDPEFDHLPDSILQETFILHSYRCTLFSIGSGKRIGSGAGSCNSREIKYAQRKGKAKCPECGQRTIIHGKGGGLWICWQKPGVSNGCGARFRDGDPAIDGQADEKVANENVWEQENTIRKMAMKRSMISAVLNVTGASDIFTQDITDFAGGRPAKAKDPHADGVEHPSGGCARCAAAGVPKDLSAVLNKGRIYVRDKAGHPLDVIYNDSAGAPQPAAPASSAAAGDDKTAAPGPSRPAGTGVQDAPGSSAQKNPEIDTFLEFMLRSMRPYPDGVGGQEYYRVLGGCGFERANLVEPAAERARVREAMNQAYRDLKAAAETRAAETKAAVHGPRHAGVHDAPGASTPGSPTKGELFQDEPGATG